MTLLNIGEMAKILSDDIKANNAEITWLTMSKLRDVAAHRYHTLQMEDVWNMVNEDVPNWRELVKKVISINDHNT